MFHKVTSFTSYQIDEAHERSIYSDLMLGILKKYGKAPPTLGFVLI